MEQSRDRTRNIQSVRWCVSSPYGKPLLRFQNNEGSSLVPLPSFLTKLLLKYEVSSNFIIGLPFGANCQFSGKDTHSVEPVE